MASISQRRVIAHSGGGFAFRAALFLFLLGCVLLEFPGANEVLRAPYSGMQTRNLVVQSVDPSGPAGTSGVSPGDEIIAVDGIRLRNNIHFHRVVADNERFAPQTYTLRRAGTVQTAVVRYAPVPDTVVATRFAYLVVAFAFLGVGLWVFLRRPDLLGSLFVSNCALLLFFLTDRPSAAVPALQLAGELIHDALILAFPATLFHFFLVFTDRGQKHVLGAKKRFIVALYTLPVLIYAADSYLVLQRFAFEPVSAPAISLLLITSTAYFGLVGVLSLMMFLRRYRAASPANKLKMRTVFAGSALGFLPFLAVTILRNSVESSISPALEAASVLCLGFVPLSFAYAILRHGAIELNLVVRRSLVYAFLTGALIAAYYAAVNVAGGVIVRELGVSEYLWMPLTILVLAALFAPTRERIQRAVDRVFFRGAYDFKREVFEYNRLLTRKRTRAEIAECFSERVRSLLRPEYVVFYLRGADRQLLRHPASSAMPERFPLDCFLGRYLSRFRAPLLTEYLDRSWARRQLDDDSRAFLATDGLGACVPLVAHDGIVAVAFLGTRRSGTPYRQGDAELLETLAERTALVLENAELLETSLEQERLKGEVMLARDIQMSLLPVAAPSNPQIEIHGQMSSSHEVGGDYYDYFEVSPRRVALAIGDVSGKGVPAAMLMASLRAVFKHAAIKGKLPPAEVNTELNEFLYENAKDDQFATFFYGVLDLDDGSFVFSNAGQCPALLVRDGYVDRLGEGGLVLGVQADAEYREGRVALAPGDRIVLYTDGITEQHSPDGDDYGEERLVRFLHMNRNLPVAELQKALLSDVMTFGHGNQADDMTSVIASLKIA